MTGYTLYQNWQKADQKATKRTATVLCNRLRSIHRALSLLIPVGVWENVHHHLFVKALLSTDCASFFFFVLFVQSLIMYYHSKNGILATCAFIYSGRVKRLQKNVHFLCLPRFSASYSYLFTLVKSPESVLSFHLKILCLQYFFTES